MSCPSRLVNIEEPLVVDTSVLINLHASNYGRQILAALPHDIVVPEVVARELTHETSRNNGEFDFLNALATDGIVAFANFTDEEQDIFHDLISISPSLDDGEAGTIAIASLRRLMPVIDERKARKRASAFMNNLEPGWSLDIFMHPAVASTLGEPLSVDALYFALRDGRMRIPQEAVERVIACLGLDRARDCTSLPGYRERFIKGHPLT